MDDATRLRAAEQAVVKAALQRGWLTSATLGEARASAASTGAPLLHALQPRLDPQQRQALAEVHRAALALSGPAPTPRPALPAVTASPATATPGPATAEAQAAAAAWSGAGSEEAPPTRLGHYEVERELARGGMGVVYLARHVDLERRVALKVLLPRDGDEGEDAAHRFGREARILEAVQHPAIVRLYEVGQAGRRRWMALELVSGGSLEQRLAASGPLEPRAAAETIERIARALAVAHGKGLLHRDLKPANILLDEDGAAKLTDFGIAKPLDASTRQLTSSGVAVGTPAYSPPEQCGGGRAIDARADVYGLGATLHALLTGRPPFEGTFAHVMNQVVRVGAEPPSARRPDVPAALDRVVLRCMEKEPDARYPTVVALADDLARFLRGEAPVGAHVPLGAWLRSNPMLVATVFAVVVLGALVAAYARS